MTDDPPAYVLGDDDAAFGAALDAHGGELFVYAPLGSRTATPARIRAAAARLGKTVTVQPAWGDFLRDRDGADYFWVTAW